MEKYPYKFNIVPKKGLHAKPKREMEFAFLGELASQLKEEQAICIKIPNLNKVASAYYAWKKTTDNKGKALREKQKDGSYLLYLWLEKE